MTRPLLFILFLFLFCNLHSTEFETTSRTNTQENILYQIGREFLEGIVKSNYREVTIDQYISVKRMPFSEIRLPRKLSHPRLLFTQAEKNYILARQSKDPYKDWAADILNTTITYSYDPRSPLLCELKRSYVAKMNAFSWLLTRRESFKQEAKTALLNISETIKPANGEGGVPGENWGDWMEASEALRNFSVAYDLLYDQFSDDEQEYIIDCLSAKTEQIYQNFVRYPTNLKPLNLSLGLGIPKNNHITQIAIGVATVAMTIDHPRSDIWLQDALQEIASGLALIMKDGSYIEGPGYANFINYYLYPFYFYLRNVTGANMLEHPVINRFNKWLIDMEMPDGSLPQLDDTHQLVYFYKPIGVGFSPISSELRFLHDQQQNRFRSGNINYVEAFCAFDDHVKPKKPEYSNFYPDGGYTIFRGDYDIVGHFSGEANRPNISYHDHIEPMSFICYAYDHQFLIDAGYGTEGVYGNDRNWFLSARAHNIPLINGLGPDQNPVWGDDLSVNMQDYFNMNNLMYTAMKTNYRNTDIKRNIWLVDKNFFVVYDRLNSDDENRFSIPWHSVGDFSKIGINKVKWEMEEAYLDAEFLAIEPDPVKLFTRRGLNTHFTESNHPHTLVEANFTVSDQASLVSLFVPQPKDNKHMVTEHITVNSQGKTEARQLIKLDKNASTIIVLAESDWEYQNIKTDADLSIIQRSFSEEVFSFVAATYLQIDNEIIFKSDYPIDITYDHLKNQSFISISEQTNIRFRQNCDPGFIILDDKTQEYVWDDNMVDFTADRSGILKFGQFVSGIKMTQPVRDDLSMLTKLSSSFQPQQEYDKLNQFEKIQLRNEVIDYTANKTISELNSMLGNDKFLQNFHNIFTGYFRSAYSHLDNFVLCLPQSFRFERNLGPVKLNYYEEGFLQENGLNAGKHRFSLRIAEKSLYYSYDKDFVDYQLHSLHLNLRKQYGRIDWQKHLDNEAYFVEVYSQIPKGWIDISHQENQFDNFNNNTLTCSYDSWYSAFNRISADESTKYDILTKKNGKSFSFGVNSYFEENEGWQKVIISNSAKLGKNNHLTFQTHYAEPNDYSLAGVWYTNWKRVGNNLNVTNDHVNNLVLQNNTSLQHKNLKFNSRISYDKVLYGFFNAILQWPRYSLSTTTSKDEKIALEVNYTQNSFFSYSTKIDWDYKASALNRSSIGLFYNNFWNIGSSIFYNKLNVYDEYGISSLIEVPISAVNYLIAIPEFCWQNNGDISYYSIDLRQRGHDISPGILITHNQRELLRCEGYLLWRF